MIPHKFKIVLAQDEARFEKLEKKVEFLERELKNVDVDVFATCCY
jgi:hypothetical protein